MLRLILASFYDIFVSVSGNDILLPDGKFYSIGGRYIAILLNGFHKDSITLDMVASDPESRRLFKDVFQKAGGSFPALDNETSVFIYLVGIIYFIFGYCPLLIRILNIVLSIGSVILIYKVAKRHFSVMAANMFLLAGLFLPTHVIYSITLSRDLLRMFVVYVILWIIYGGVICLKKEKKP